MTEYNYDIFMSHKRKNRLEANRWPCSNVVLLSISFANFFSRLGHSYEQDGFRCFQSTFGIPLLLLWLSYRALKWIRCAFEEGSKVMRRFTLFMNISFLLHDAKLFAPRTSVRETVNIGSVMRFRNNPCSDNNKKRYGKD